MSDSIPYIALLGARSYVSAAANTGQLRAAGVLDLIDKAIAQLKPPEIPAPVPEEKWQFP